MNPSIYRVMVPVKDFQELTLPGPPLSVACARDGSSDCFDLWYEFYDWPPSRQKRCGIWVMGTGHDTPWATPAERQKYEHLGTLVTPSDLVWHVFWKELRTWDHD